MKKSMLSAALLVGVFLPKKLGILQGSPISILDARPEIVVMIEK